MSGEGTGNVHIKQSTKKAIIEWKGFDIGKGEKTRFSQPGKNAVTLNRVTGGLGKSTIDGILKANGKVFLINPDGILFGQNAIIDVHALLATTHDIANDDFMAGNYRFNQPGKPGASVVNLGSITASDGGFAALVAPGVRNDGVITARLGSIGLSAANGFTLDFYGDQLITLSVSDEIAAEVLDLATGKPLKSLVSNSGKLEADGGTVALTAVAARRVVDSVINNEGVIEANSVGKRNGKIILGGATAATKPAGTPNQKVKVSGTLDVSGKGDGESGGKIQITGETIEVAGAVIDATGSAGGGTVLIGGDVGGGAPRPDLVPIPRARPEPDEIDIAKVVIIDGATDVDASAIAHGDGGKVVVWADGKTSFDGVIAVRGGEAKGDGGFVEVSGKKQLSFDGRVDLSASGSAGTLLLDPLDVIIRNNSGPGVVTVSTLQNALASGNVVVTTKVSGGGPGDPGAEIGRNGDITVADPLSWSSANRLTLEANRDIAINAAIKALNGGLVIDAGNDITVPAAVSVDFFELRDGSWVQVTSELPAFKANDFRVTSTSSDLLFLRMAGGTGSLSKPYRIADIYGLQGISTEYDLLGMNFILVDDIDLKTAKNWWDGQGFVPIGCINVDCSYGWYGGIRGKFNGNGNKISSIKSVLFSDINGSVENLNVHQDGGMLTWLNEGLIDNVHSSGWVGGSAFGYAGGLLESNNGTIRDSSSTARVLARTAGGLVAWNSGIIQRSHATGRVETGEFADDAGGLVGVSFGTIEDSYATGDVFGGDGSSVGGLVGEHDGEIKRSYATGSVFGGKNAYVGGLIGFSYDGLIQESFASGSATGGKNSWVGGLAGGIYDTDAFRTYATGAVESDYGIVGGLVGVVETPLDGSIVQSYAIGPVSNSGTFPDFYLGATVDGGLIGHASSVGATASSYFDIQATTQTQTAGGGAGLMTTEFVAGLPPGFDPSVWTIQPGETYPYFAWQPADTIPIADIAAAPPTPPVTPPAPPPEPPIDPPPFPPEPGDPPSTPPEPPSQPDVLTPSQDDSSDFSDPFGANQIAGLVDFVPAGPDASNVPEVIFTALGIWIEPDDDYPSTYSSGPYRSGGNSVAALEGREEDLQQAIKEAKATLQAAKAALRAAITKNKQLLDQAASTADIVIKLRLLSETAESLQKSLAVQKTVDELEAMLISLGVELDETQVALASAHQEQAAEWVWASLVTIAPPGLVSNTVAALPGPVNATTQVASVGVVGSALNAMWTAGRDFVQGLIDDEAPQYEWKDLGEGPACLVDATSCIAPPSEYKPVPSSLAGTLNQYGDQYERVEPVLGNTPHVTWGYNGSSVVRGGGRTMYEPIDQMTIVTRGRQHTLNSYANVTPDGSYDVTGMFQCTALIAEYLELLGLDRKALGDGREVASNAYYKYSGAFTPPDGKTPPQVGTIISMEIGNGGVVDSNRPGPGHVAIVKGVKEISDSKIEVTLIEQNIQDKRGAAINRTIAFTKDASGAWSATHMPGSYPYDVRNWVTPLVLP
ncbi:filamentous hemagglutinin N-terminal domain-containing protein [Hyphomonas sp.]|uniref:two-partner secretion domain-containing protein n=1 Tax=Alphaproteobacteria TaxID=28211 RepID=UPI003265EEFA